LGWVDCCIGLALRCLNDVYGVRQCEGMAFGCGLWGWKHSAAAFKFQIGKGRMDGTVLHENENDHVAEIASRDIT
jgi:hypothetical protein